MQGIAGQRAWAVVLGLVVGFASAGARAATPAAQYQVRFDGTWSATSHPLGFPGNAHFSSLIGGTHDASVHFWNPGELASQGIKDMAERGLTSPLDHEVEAAMATGHAGVVIRGGGISPSPGVATATFTITQAFPLVSLVSMIAPSPDWFVGVGSVPLFRDGAWVERIVVPLYAYDAGTDCGTSYSAPNCISAPPELIAASTAPPFTNGAALGLFTFTRIDAQTSITVPATSNLSLLGIAGLLLAAGGFVLQRRLARSSA